MDGYDPATSPHKVRQTFGIVFQDPSLDEELTAYENMDYHGILYNVPKQTRKERIEELLRIVELWDRRKDFVKHFSGGMKRRLGDRTRTPPPPEHSFSRRTHPRSRPPDKEPHLESRQRT